MREKFAMWWSRWGAFVFFYLAIMNLTSGGRAFAQEEYLWSGFAFVVGVLCWASSLKMRRKEIEDFRNLAIASQRLIDLTETKNELEQRFAADDRNL